MKFDSLREQIAGTPLAPLAPFLEMSFLDQIRHGDFPRWRRRLAELPAIRAKHYSVSDEIQIGAAAEIEPEIADTLRNQLFEFVPWRKGPFNIFGIEIDAEWRCEKKWQRILPHLADLQGRSVLDVGCGNGYYAYRMHDQGARLTIGLDQHMPYVAQFWASKHFVPDLPLYVLPLAFQSLPQDLEAFDTAFSLGVLYHVKSPIEHLLQLRSSLRAEGELVLETLVVPGDDGYCLTPTDTYARMARLWFIPTTSTLTRWLARCGFADIRVVSESKTGEEEQRRTAWMPYDSLASALDSQNPDKTIEGLPAPTRAVILARRI